MPLRCSRSSFKAWGDLNCNRDSKPTSSCPGNAPALKLSLIPCAKTSAPQGSPRKSRRWSRDMSSWDITQSCARINQDNLVFFGPHFCQAAQKQQQIEQHETPQHSVQARSKTPQHARQFLRWKTIQAQSIGLMFLLAECVWILGQVYGLQEASCLPNVLFSSNEGLGNVQGCIQEAEKVDITRKMRKA